MLFQPGQINVVFSSGTKILEELNYEMDYHAKKTLLRGESFGWLNGKGLTALTESKVMALQGQEVGVKVTRKEIWKEKLENITL